MLALFLYFWYNKMDYKKRKFHPFEIEKQGGFHP